MLYALYLIVAIGVTFLSVKAADYVDCIDKKTSLSGAFIGGIMLSAVTSLPELFTSFTSSVLLDEPGLCIGNILGSDLFNMLILGVLGLVFLNSFAKANISNSHLVVMTTVLASYLAVLLNKLGILDVDVVTVSVTSVILLICYGISVRFLSEEDGEADENADDIKLTLKQIVIRFVIASIGIIALSIVISYITDAISAKLNLGKGIAGALFMGIATSLPEMASTITLFKKKNFDVAVGNIVGSNIFNMIILAIADICYIKGDVYDYSDPKTVNLLYCGLVAVPLLMIALKMKNRFIKGICLVGIIACYAAFLII